MASADRLDFTQGSVMRHVIVMSFTSSIGIMAIYLVDLFDIFFISLLGQKQMAAAAGYGSTMLFFISAINLGLSIAAGALVAKSMGAKKHQEAREITTAVAIVAVIIGIIIPVILFPAAPWLVKQLGATDPVVSELAVTYFRIILPASCLSGISMACVVALRAYGDAKWSMYPSLCGALVNLIFDPILIFGLNMDIAGAASSTVLARIATMSVALYATIKRHDGLVKPELKLVAKHGRDIASYSVPGVLSSVAAPIGQALLTRYFARYGADAVAAIAIVGRISPVVFSVINALSGAIGPIIGQNYGAGHVDRVRQSFRSALIFLGTYVAAAGVVLFLLRPVLADAFRVDGLTKELMFLYCGPLAIVAFFNGTIFISNAAYNNLGSPRYSTRLNWAKNTVGLWPCLAIGAALGGAKGVAFGAVTSAGIFALISIYFVQRIWDRIGSEADSDAGESYDNARQTAMLNGSSEPMHT